MAGNRKAKWQEYRRILKELRSVCHDCDGACSQCQLWARERAFGREPTGYLAKECAEAYRFATSGRLISIAIEG